MPDATTMKSETVGTVRTTTNATLLSLVLALIAHYTKWKIQANDLLPYMPLIIPVVAAFYRLSLLASKKFTWLGVVLYGINAPPAYKQPAEPLDTDTTITPPSRGYTTMINILIGLAIILVVVLIIHFVDVNVN